MPPLKRASERTGEDGIMIEVHMGPYGPLFARSIPCAANAKNRSSGAGRVDLCSAPRKETRADGWPCSAHRAGEDRAAEPVGRCATVCGGVHGLDVLLRNTPAGLLMALHLC